MALDAVRTSDDRPVAVYALGQLLSPIDHRAGAREIPARTVLDLELGGNLVL
jgi:hypothetical protein